MQPMGAPSLSTRAMEAQISCSGAALIAVGGLAAPATPPTHFLSFTMSAWGKPPAAFMLLMVGLGTPVQVASSSPWCSTAPPSRQTPASSALRTRSAHPPLQTLRSVPLAQLARGEVRLRATACIVLRALGSPAAQILAASLLVYLAPLAHMARHLAFLLRRVPATAAPPQLMLARLAHRAIGAAGAHYRAHCALRELLGARKTSLRPPALETAPTTQGITALLAP